MCVGFDVSVLVVGYLMVISVVMDTHAILLMVKRSWLMVSVPFLPWEFDGNRW